jgi:hypothetical protein
MHQRYVLVLLNVTLLSVVISHFLFLGSFADQRNLLKREEKMHTYDSYIPGMHEQNMR